MSIFALLRRCSRRRRFERERKKEKRQTEKVNEDAHFCISRRHGGAIVIVVESSAASNKQDPVSGLVGIHVQLEKMMGNIKMENKKDSV